MNLIFRVRCRLADLRGRGVYTSWSDASSAIFIHVPKTAGSSVSRQLGLSPARHIPAEDYRISSPRKFATYFKFAFVRNPFDRLVSSYTFLRQGGMNADDAHFAERKILPFEHFEHFLTAGFAHDPEIRAQVHFRPQWEFVCGAAGQNLMDFTGRFEQIARDYAVIAARIGKPADLPILNKSAHSDYRELYSPATMEIVRHYYARDLAIFGYDFA